MRRLAVTLGTMMAILCAGFLAWQAEAMVVAGATNGKWLDGKKS